jgi:hypothetical protein
MDKYTPYNQLTAKQVIEVRASFYNRSVWDNDYLYIVAARTGAVLGRKHVQHFSDVQLTAAARGELQADCNKR